MMLSDILDYIESLDIADQVYMGKLDPKPDKSIGVYNSKHQQPYTATLNGNTLASYDLKYVNLLLHWNKSPVETEIAGKRLFEAVAATREKTVNSKLIKFVQPLYALQDVGTDDSGVYEMVVEAAFVCKKGD